MVPTNTPRQQPNSVFDSYDVLYCKQIVVILKQN